MRKRAYIAGPISKGDLCHNLNQATAAFVALAKAGFAPLCPHWSVYSKPATKRTETHFEADCECEDGWVEVDTVRVTCEATAMGNDDMQHADWMGVDLPWVAASDAVLRLPGESVGADMEVACARERGIPVFETVEALVAHFAARSAA